MKIRTLLLGAIAVLSASAAEAQGRRVTGRVTGNNGEPVSSASINIQGTTLGAYTGEDGRFILPSVPGGAQVLVVRRIGYRRVNQPLPATTDVVDVRMEKDVLELERQVVTGTTTTISSANSANAIAAVSGEQLNKAPTPTIENALQGKIPGAVISTNSGAPGGGAQVQLRGVTSINAASSPLYVVDGVLVNNSQISNGLNSITAAGGGINSSQDQPANRVSDLNPADIENIEVLKGASAGAIYGSKASNGVIVITTRRGTTGKPTVNAIGRIGQFTLSHKLGLRCFSSAAEVNAAGLDGDAFTAAGGGCNDFEEQLYGGNPLSYESGLSVRGGNAGTTYYVGGLAKRDNAIMRNTYYQKQSIQANLSQVIGSRLTARVNNEFIHSLTERGISGNDNAEVSPIALFSETPTWYDMSLGERNPYSSNGSNAFQNADLVRAPEDVFRYIGSVNTTLSAFTSQRQTLDFTFIAGLDTYAYNGNLISPPDLYFENQDGLPGTIVTNRTTNTNANLNLSGAHKWIGSSYTASTSFGLRQERRQSDALLNQGRNIPAGVGNVSFGVVQAVTQGRTLIKDFAYYAQEEFLALNERLLLTAAVNTERSSVNGDDKKFYAFPKFAASYRLPFLPKFTDELKFRIAAGQAGNQPPYGFKFTTLPISVLDGQLGARPSATAGSPNIKPETSREIEGGVDAQFLGGRVALDATVFQKKVSDLILSANIAVTSGFTTKLINGGNLQSTGTEIGLNVTPIQRNNFSWISRTTYANVDSRITQLAVPCFNAGSGFSLRFGLPYICGGYSPSTVQVNSGFDSTFSAAGAYVSRVRHVLSLESAPNYTMGFSNEFNIGPVRLYGLFDYRNGGYVANLTNNYFDGQGNGTTGTLADTAAVHQRNIDFSTAGGGKNVYLEKAGFVKLRELSLSFALPKTVTSSLFSNGNDVRIELSGRNLKTWTDYTGYDPEVSNFSNQNVGRFQDVTPYPPSRSFFVSINTTF
ncbi:MAG: SusC/RagA family TonB-linked outer membrane protein [Gemmatimonadaceae bacterium]